MGSRMIVQLILPAILVYYTVNDGHCCSHVKCKLFKSFCGSERCSCLGRRESETHANKTDSLTFANTFSSEFKNIR